MTASQTLLELAGAAYPPAKLRDACLVLIDMQNEYCSGPVAATGSENAIDAARELLMAARSCGAPVFHVVHKGRPGMLFDRDAERGQIIPALTPLHDEAVIEKPFPNSFACTDLRERPVRHRAQTPDPRWVRESDVHQLAGACRRRARLSHHRGGGCMCGARSAGRPRWRRAGEHRASGCAGRTCRIALPRSRAT